MNGLVGVQKEKQVENMKEKETTLRQQAATDQEEGS